MPPRRLQRFFHLGLALICLLCLFAPGAAAETTWREIRSPHFRVLTDGSEHDGRMVAHEFEQMRYAFSVLLNRTDFGSGAPLTIIAARDQTTFRDLDPVAWKSSDGRIAGLFRRGWEKQFALTRLDTWGDQNQVVIYHEYTHSVLHANSHWLPTWLDEGLAEFYGYTRFEKNQTLVGAPSARLGLLRNHPMIPVEKLLTERNPISSRDKSDTDMFYAESWAIVHFMYMGLRPDGLTNLSKFIQEIGNQVPQEKAFRDTFGDPAVFQDKLSIYLNRFAFNAAVLPADHEVDPKSYEVRTLSPADIEYEIGCYQIGAHAFAAGRTHIEKALSLDPKLAGAHEELGYLNFAEGKDEDAIAQWKAAVALDPTLPRSQFALVMTGKPLAEQTPEELHATVLALQSITHGSPTYAPPFVELALADWRLGSIQQAYKESLTAEKLEPWRSGYRLLTGRILLRGNQPAYAAQYSRYIATHWAGSDHNEAVDLWASIPPEKRGDGPPLVMEMPPGAQLVRGTLLETACGTTPGAPYTAKLQPDTPGAAPLQLASTKRVQIGFTDTLWWGEDHFSSCHHLAGHTVVALYQPQGNSAGELLGLEVRDDYPNPPASAVASTQSDSPGTKP